MINSDAWDAATTVRRARSRSVAHSACQDPSGRSSTLVAAARCRVDARGGPVRALRRINTESTGLCFCGMVDEPPPVPSASSAISGRDSVAHVGGDAPVRVGAADQGVARRGDDPRDVCHGTEGARPSALATDSTSCHETCAGSGSPRSVGQLGGRRERAGRATELHRRSRDRTPASASAASSRPVSQLAALRPKVIGTACWVRVRPTIDVDRCSATRRHRPSTCARSSSSSRSTTSRRQIISAVSRTSWLVSPRCSQRAGSELSRLRSISTKPITGLPPASAPSARALGRFRSAARGSRLCLRRRDFVFDKRVQPGVLDRPLPSAEPNRSSGRRRARPPARTDRSSLSVPGSAGRPSLPPPA